MKQRYGAFLLGTFLFFLAPQAFAATGFVDSPLLLSPESPRDGDTVTLSVLFHNAETDPIRGTVLFYDGSTLLDKKTMSIDPGDVSIASTSFVIQAGIHKFSATISDIGKDNATGKLEVVVIPETTVTLPAELVTRKIPTSASASGTADTPESGILSTVSTAENAVLGIVPPSAKKAVSSSASSVDGWRAGVAASLTAGKNAAGTAIDAGKKIDAENAAQKAGQKPKAKPANADNGPWNEVKYIFLLALAFFFAQRLVFYLGGIFLLYILIRFIVRRIRKARQNR